MELSLEDITQAFGWQLTLAAFFFLMTNFALGLMAREKKDTLALWLMGAGSEDNWSRSFLDLFDALFGERHLSARCILRSCIASLVSVSLIWGLMVWTGTLDRVAFGSLGFANALMIGVAVNFVADYISLLETRYLLGRVPKLRRVSVQALVLLIDLVITAAIILLAIWLVQRSGLFVVESADWLSVGLAFSIYSAPFYSTFLTSVWTWVYILSTWVIRGFARLRLAEWIDVEHRPTLIVSLILSGFVLLGSLGIGAALEEDDSGLSRLDMAVCTVAKGTICDRMKTLTSDPETQFLLQVYACEGGMTETCIEDGLETYEVDGARAAQLFRASCDGGSAEGCANLGWQYDFGIGLAQNPELAKKHYENACDQGAAKGCTRLAQMYEQNRLVDPSQSLASRYHGRACVLSQENGCWGLLDLYHSSPPLIVDLVSGLNELGQSCRSGSEASCSIMRTRLGLFFDEISMDVASASSVGPDCKGLDHLACEIIHSVYAPHILIDPMLVDKAYRTACKHGDLPGCVVGDSFYEEDLTPVGYLDAVEATCLNDINDACKTAGLAWATGFSGEINLENANRLLGISCSAGDPDSCAWQGNIMQRLGVPLEKLVSPDGVFDRACLLHSPLACISLARGKLALDPHNPDFVEIERTFHFFCSRGQAVSCLFAGWLHRAGIGTSPNPVVAKSYFEKGCQLIGREKSPYSLELCWANQGVNFH